MQLPNRILVSASLIFALAACASSEPQRHKKANRFDTDGDGYMSRTEYAQSALSDVVEFDSLDKDGDDLLSPSELGMQIGNTRRELRDRASKSGRPGSRP